MQLTQYVSNHEGIIAVFGEAVPSLDRVRLHEVRLDYMRGLLRLRLDLAGFPENPPRKWVQSGFNVVQLELQAVGVRAIDARGDITGEPLPSRVILKKDSVLEIKIESARLVLSCQVKELLLARISAYQDAVPFG